MPFATGSVSFRKFAVIGDASRVPDQELLDKLAAHRFPSDSEREAVPVEEVEYGWCGGRHLYDASFGFGHNAYADHLLFALRIDTNQVPAEVRRALIAIDEAAAAKSNPSGFISKLQRKEVKAAVDRRLDDERKTGKFRRSRLLPVLWDLPRGTLYAPASGTNFEKLAEIFERTFGLTLVPQTAAAIAERYVDGAAKRKQFEDLRPTAFAVGPEGEDQQAEYPWVSKQHDPKNFLGDEFLVWLWHRADVGTSSVDVPGSGEVTFYFDKSIDLDCAYGQTGKDSIRGDGPTRSAEAREALRVGKVPRKAGLILDVGKEQFSLTLDAENFGYAGLKLPDVAEADTPRTLLEERLKLLADAVAAVEGMFTAFLKTRVSPRWQEHAAEITEWIKPEPAVAGAA